MSRSNILALVEALRNQAHVAIGWQHGVSPQNGCAFSMDGAKHNELVDAAAKALVAEIERPLSAEDAAKELGKTIGHAEFLRFDADFKNPVKRAMMKQMLGQKRNDFYKPHPGDDVPSRTRLDDNYPDVRVCTECGRARRAYEDSCPKCGYGFGF